MHPRVTFDADKCKACELCIEACPPKIIRLSDQVNRQGYRPATVVDQERCTSCRACAIICPDYVITVYRVAKVS